MSASLTLSEAMRAFVFVAGLLFAGAVAAQSGSPSNLIIDIKPDPSAPPPDGAAMFKQAQDMEKAGNKDAVRVYRRAARAGSGPAAKRLGDIYSCGALGLAPDRNEALNWYDSARKLKAKGVPPQGLSKKC
jgi:TPR repeat protein